MDGHQEFLRLDGQVAFKSGPERSAIKAACLQ